MNGIAIIESILEPVLRMEEFGNLKYSNANKPLNNIYGILPYIFPHAEMDWFLFVSGFRDFGVSSSAPCWPGSIGVSGTTSTSSTNSSSAE